MQYRRRQRRRRRGRPPRTPFVTVGDVCRLSDDSAYVFIGQFDTSGSTPRRLNNIQGTIDIRVADDGGAIVTAVEL